MDFIVFLQKNAENMIDIKCKQEGSLSNVAKCAANKIWCQNGVLSHDTAFLR